MTKLTQKDGGRLFPKDRARMMAAPKRRDLYYVEAAQRVLGWRTIEIHRVKKRFAEVIRRVSENGETFVVEASARPVVAILSIKDLIIPKPDAQRQHQSPPTTLEATFGSVKIRRTLLTIQPPTVAPKLKRPLSWRKMREIIREERAEKEMRILAQGRRKN